MVAKLQQHRGEPGLADLSQRGGGPCGHLLRQGVDVPEVFHEQLRRPAAVGAGGIVEGENAPALALGAGAGGVGVEGQVEVKVSRVGGGDGVGRRHTGGVPVIPDAGGVQIGDHLVGQKVHIRFLGAPGDVIVILLRGGGEIDNGHSDTSVFSPFYEKQGDLVRRSP